jgi:hypothetical protein
MKRISRRGWLAGVSAAPLLAQAPGAAKPTKDEDLNTAREGVRNNREQLAKFKVPLATEPAFQFKP